MCSGRVYHNYVFQSCLIYINNNHIIHACIFNTRNCGLVLGGGGRMRVRGIALLVFK